MFATERHQKIQQVLLEYKRADVSRLSKLLSVSEVTIRKDLEFLEGEGFLIRTHGGAVLNEGLSTSELPVYSTDTDELERKQMIGSIAAQLISNGDLIYLGCGTTCIEVSRNLRTKQILTVITNNISAAIELSKNPEITVITTGGNLVRKNNVFSLIGPSILDFASQLSLDKAIISIDAVQLERGYSLQDEMLGKIYNQMIERSNQTIICASSDKYNKNAFSNFASITDADIIVTDEAAPENYIKFFFENNIRVYNTYNIKHI